MDSRAYVFIFPVNRAADVPADFLPTMGGRKFEAGVFLPQADTSWFTESPQYPARLLLLNERTLYIVPHPTADQLPLEIRLDDLVEIETGSTLLCGWIRLITAAGAHRLLYNTRASGRLEAYIALVIARWLGAPQKAAYAPKIFGDDLDIKFRNLLHDALAPDETVLLQYFAAPVQYQQRVLFFRRVKGKPGFLVAVTSANRVVCCSDEYRGRWNRYAGITASFPLALLRSSAVEDSNGGQILILNFAAQTSWRASFAERKPYCREFAEAVNDFTTLSGLNVAKA